MALLRQKILILDRGSKYYKGLLFEYGFGSFEILKKEKLPIIKELSFLEDAQEDKNQDISIFEYNFLRFTKTLFTEQNELVFLFKNNEVFIRNLEIPAEKEEVALEVLENEIEGYLPYNLEDVQVVPNLIKLENGIANVMGIAVRNELLENYSKIIVDNGFSLDLIGVESIALASAIELLPESEYNKKVLLQLDIGYEKTLLNLIDKGKLIFSRIIPFGVSNLLNLLKTYSNIKDEEYLEKILFESFPNIIQNNIDYLQTIENKQKFIKDFKEEWDFFTEELKRTLLMLNYDHYSYLLLSGGGCLISGINESIEASLNLQTKYYEIQLGDDPVEPWMICLGGFFYFQKNQKDRVDFLNTPLGKTLKRSEIRLQAFNIPAIITGVSILIFLISFVISILLERKQLEFYRSKIQEVASTIPGAEKSNNPVRFVKNLCNEKLGYWKNIVAGAKFLDIIKEINEHTVGPDVAKIQFKSLSYTENQVELELEVDSIGNVVKVQEEFQKSRLFSTVEVVRRDLIAGQKVRLGLSLKIKPRDIQIGVDCK